MPANPTPSPPLEHAAPRRRWRHAAFNAAVVAVTLALAWGMARWELVRRARHAYLEGEKYYAWYLNPALKRAHFDGELAAGRINADQMQLLLEDSDLKNAYVWYDTAVELYQPPRSPWVLKSEARLRQLKPLYDAWLKSLGITPVDDGPPADSKG